MSNTPFRLRDIGPGLVIAATGLGAGDLVAASVAGAKYGTTILWAAILGAIMKFAMNEGLMRWQLATGTTLLEGWVQRLPRIVSAYFFIYLLLWSFVVAAALISATGLAAHALLPGLSLETWGILHSLLAAALVLIGRYRALEALMKVFMALMMVVVMVCAVLVAPELSDILRGLAPSKPEGSLVFILGVIGGVGGSVTMLCYGYWIREHGWNTRDDLVRSRRDLAVAYLLTGLFGIAIMIVSAGLHPETVTGPKMALAVASQLETVVGPFGRWCVLVGFRAAVFTSMLGVWQGVPYLFADFIQQHTRTADRFRPVDTRSTAYRGYLLYIAIPPMVMLLLGKPVWLILVYAVAGAFFMPLLGVLLMVMNNRSSWVQDLRYGPVMNLVLLASIAVFGLLLYDKLMQSLG